MAYKGISREVEQFIAAHITTVRQLETLLFLSGHADREWNAAQLGKVLYSQPEVALIWLVGFQQAGLLSTQESGPISDQTPYLYQPSTMTLRCTVLQLDRDYKEHKDAIIHVILAKPDSSISLFADAFRIRKDDGKTD